MASDPTARRPWDRHGEPCLCPAGFLKPEKTRFKLYAGGIVVFHGAHKTVVGVLDFALGKLFHAPLTESATKW